MHGQSMVIGTVCLHGLGDDSSIFHMVLHLEQKFVERRKIINLERLPSFRHKISLRIIRGANERAVFENCTFTVSLRAADH